MRCNILCFCNRLLIFFLKKLAFHKILSGTLSERKTVWIQVKTDVSVGPELGPNCSKVLSRQQKSPLDSYLDNNGRLTNADNYTKNKTL